MRLLFPDLWGFLMLNPQIRHRLLPIPNHVTGSTVNHRLAQVREILSLLTESKAGSVLVAARLFPKIKGEGDVGHEYQVFPLKHF